MKHVVGMVGLAFVSACSGESVENKETAIVEATPTQIQYAEDAVPGDAGLAAIYERSCRACHAVDGMGAPLTGHGSAWEARLEIKSMDELLTATKIGVNAMPAMGLCADCSDEDLRALIAFMAKKEN